MFKKRTRLIIISFLLLIFYTNSIFSQSNFSIRATSVIFNPLDTLNCDIYKNKISSDGFLTFEPGLNFAVELFGNDVTSAKLSQSLRLDACSKLCGTTQLLLRFRLLKKWKNTLTAGIGPVFFYRQSWQDIENYEQETYYNSNSMQSSVMWLSGEIEYNFYMSKHSDLSISINHISPRAFGILVGYKYWFSRKSNKCNTCPSYRN